MVSSPVAEVIPSRAEGLAVTFTEVDAELFRTGWSSSTHLDLIILVTDFVLLRL